MALLPYHHICVVSQVVMSYLSFLCVRLLDLRNETRAARVIQDAWRKYRLKKDQELYQVSFTAMCSTNNKKRHTHTGEYITKTPPKT